MMNHATNPEEQRRAFYRLCMDELSQADPDFQAAQVYAILSLEEAVREMAKALARMSDRLVAAL